MSVTLDPGVLAFLAIGVALYIRAVGVARGRGLEVGRFQQAAFYAGVALWAVAMVRHSTTSRRTCSRRTWPSISCSPSWAVR